MLIGSSPAILGVVPPSETQLLISNSRALRERNRELFRELTMTLDQILNAANRALEISSKLLLETPSKRVDLSELLDRLTNRERTVLTLVAGGYSTKEVAARLGIAFKTAVCHRTHVMETLGIHDAASLTRFAIRNGLIRA